MLGNYYHFWLHLKRSLQRNSILSIFSCIFYCSFAAQPNPYAAAPPQNTHKMKDRSTVTTAATPLQTVTVPSSVAQQITQKPTAPASSAIPIVADTKQTTIQSNKAINDSNGVSTSSQTAKPTSTPVSVSATVESTESIEISNVEFNTKGNLCDL